MAPPGFRDALAAQDGGRHLATSINCCIAFTWLFRRLDFIFNGLSFEIFILINSDPILRDVLHLTRKTVEDVQLAALRVHLIEEVLGETLDLPEDVLATSSD